MKQFIQIIDRQFLKMTALFLWIVFLFWRLSGFWDGDPTIYFVYAKNLLSGDGLCFNIGHPSASFSSPLWLAIVTLCGANPAFVKIAALIIFLVGILFINNHKGMIIAAVVVYLSFRYSFYCYETPLIVLATGMFLTKRNGWATFIFTLARPEALLIMVFVSLFYEIKWIAILPAIFYYALTFLLLGVPGSFTSRSVLFSSWTETRYLLVFLPVIVLIIGEIIQEDGWRQHLIFGLCIVGTIIKLHIPGYTFDVITMRDIVPFVRPDDVIYTTEIQTKFWLPRDIFVVSSDKLLKEQKPPTLFLKTINDPPRENQKFIMKPKLNTTEGLYRLDSIK